MTGPRLDPLTPTQQSVVKQWAQARHEQAVLQAEAQKLLDHVHEEIVCGTDEAARAYQQKRAGVVQRADAQGSLASDLWHQLTAGGR